MKNSRSTKGPIKQKIKNQFKNPPLKTKRKKTGKNSPVPMKKKLLLLAFIISVLSVIPKFFSISSDYLQSPKTQSVPCIWEICSIDTMKTSRDKARENLYNLAYDANIKEELRIIKETGANYVAIDTPYDAEFLPYLRRWVKYSREANLKVWFRGNWSNWEGWFEYPKNMSSSQHLEKTNEFIVNNTDLFESGDIFDPCPECENAGFWPQPEADKDYQQFIRTQQEQTEASFRKIKKWVKVHQSIIGGRAKDVVTDKQTYNILGNIVAIDHYVKDAEGMDSYIKYFKNNFQTKTLVSEFGAPIPDMNGPMSGNEQAEFIEGILKILYQNRDSVEGLNYWVLSLGTTSLVSDSSNLKPAYEVLKKYFSPGLIQGNIKNSLGENLQNITVKTNDNFSKTKTDNNGNYNLTLPQGEYQLVLEDNQYAPQSKNFSITKSGNIETANFTLDPKSSGLIYNLKLWWKNTF